MRNNDPLFWPDSSIELDIKQKRNANYNDSINILQTQWYQFDLDQRFVMGDQDLWGLIFPGVATYRKKIFNFNLTNRAIQMVSGYQRRNRKTTTCIPILNAAQKTSDQLTKCLFHVHNRTGAYQIYSDCFEQGALTQGLGFLSIYNDMTSDVISGDIKLRYIDPKSCTYDPFMRAHDMSDCRFFETSQFFFKEECATLYGDFYDEIMNVPSGSYRDDKYYYMPEVYQIQFPNLIAMDEYWYLTNREATYLIDRETEECQEWTGDEEQLRDLMGGRNPVSGQLFRKQLKVVQKRKPTVRRTILINDKVLVDEANPYKIDRYPVVPCLGYVTSDSPYYAYKYRGIARDMRDCQYLFNRLKVNDLDQVEAQQHGIKMEQGALVTPDDALNQGNGRVLMTRPNMFDKVDKLHIDPPAATLLQMEDMLKQTMMEISGINEELLGSAIDEKAGILSMLRQGAGLTTLQRLFDQFDEFQKIAGDIIIEMIQKNWTYGKVKLVIGEEPSDEFDNKLFFQYGCKVATGVLTESQEQLEAQQLIYVKQELGIPISSKRILSKLVLQDKDELIAEVEAQEKQQMQQAQQMAQLQMQQLDIDNKTKLSYSQAQKSLSNEREAKILTDRAVAEDKLKRAHQEDTSALLNLVKTLKELKGLDLDHLSKQIEVLDKLAPEGSPTTGGTQENVA